ncbi:MAG: type I DNA topoisomerase [Proteobacteria bacterium]|jgi:DNA topoisomerase-1|nr:type I DNA topoisomerase [Pseudomonadota bacterium]
MSKSLVIVESPAKARTIRKYLGPSYVVKASLGHVKDLPKSKMGVAIDRSFEPEYQVIPGKRKVLKDLVKSAETADKIFLALDPDREGEAIAWHIAEELGVDASRLSRVMFNEITRKGIAEGLDHPLSLNTRRFESQQARRILDRLVGYEISPILWKKVRRGLSAGRVQSVAVRLVVDREHEISAFVPKEYWKIGAEVTGFAPPPFMARYWGTDGKRNEINDEATALAVKGEIERSSFTVSSVERKERKRQAPPPLITSRLQQEMARRYRFTAKRTMMVAQQLYEGVDVGSEGTVGLITYMRTDSVRLSTDAVDEARDYIKEAFGDDAVPGKPNVFKSRKGAQDAHEAIRPTSVRYLPDAVGKYLSADQRKLYRVVWERFVACQMKPAVYDQTAVTVEAGRHTLRVSGSILKFRGWLEATDDQGAANGKNGDAETDEEVAELPALAVGDQLSLTSVGVVPEQKFTQAPPRFTEGTLIRELEERGIGRPSTYATILSTIQERRYVMKEDGRLNPSELGELVTDRLVRHFPRILDADFTASMEESLDKIEDGTEDWVVLLQEFYKPFHIEVQTALKEMEDVRDMRVESAELCELCGKPMVVKWGRNGRFLACTGFPACRNTREMESGAPSAPPEAIDLACTECGKPMVRKRGRFGDFLACSGYPACKATRSVPTGIACPKPGCKGELVERRTKTGRVFFGCSEYKANGCDFVIWGTPVKETCPDCGAGFLVAAGRRRGGRELKCTAAGCSFKRAENTEG